MKGEQLMCALGRTHARPICRPARVRVCACACTHIHIQLKVEMDRKWLIKSRRFRLLCVFFRCCFLCCCSHVLFYYYFFFHSFILSPLLSYILCSYSILFWILYIQQHNFDERKEKERERNKLKNKWNLVTSKHMNQIYMITYHKEWNDTFYCIHHHKCSTLKIDKKEQEISTTTTTTATKTK